MNLAEFQKLQGQKLTKPSSQSDGLVFSGQTNDPTQYDTDITNPLSSEYIAKYDNEEAYYPLPKLYTKDGKQIHISQSLIKSYLKTTCEVKFYNYSVLRSIKTDADDEESVAVRDGLRFEYLVTGATDRQGNIPGELLTAKSKKRMSINDGIEKAAKYCIQILEDDGFDLEAAKAEGGVGLELFTDSGIRGEMDLVIPIKKDSPLFKLDVGNGHCNGITLNIENQKAIIDIKRSGLINSKAYSPLGWNFKHRDRDDYIQHSPEKVIQANHYQILFAEKYDYVPRFFYLVSDNRKDKEQDIYLIEMVTSEQSRIKHLERIHVTVAGVQSIIDRDPTHEPSIKECKSCKVQDCPARMVRHPKITVHML